MVNLQQQSTTSMTVIKTEFPVQRRKTKFPINDKIPLLQQVQTIKIFGITFTSSLSAMLHVHSITAACAQTLYALHSLSCISMKGVTVHCMISSTQLPLQNSCMHPTPGGDSPMPTTDRRSLLLFVAAFALVSVLQIYPTFTTFTFLQMRNYLRKSTCPNRILRALLPPTTAQNYSLRNRPHNRQLPDCISEIMGCNFTFKMLYRNMYWLIYILAPCFVLFLCATAVWQFVINGYVMFF